MNHGIKIQSVSMSSAPSDHMTTPVTQQILARPSKWLNGLRYEFFRTGDQFAAWIVFDSTLDVRPVNFQRIPAFVYPSSRIAYKAISAKRGWCEFGELTVRFTSEHDGARMGNECTTETFLSDVVGYENGCGDDLPMTTWQEQLEGKPHLMLAMLRNRGQLTFEVISIYDAAPLVE